MAWFRTFLHRPETHSWFFNFHNNSLLNSPSGFITGGLGSVAVLLYYQLKHKVDGISGIRMSPPLKLTQKKFVMHWLWYQEQQDRKLKLILYYKLIKLYRRICTEGKYLQFVKKEVKEERERESSFSKVKDSYNYWGLLAHVTYLYKENHFQGEGRANSRELLVSLVFS